MFRFLFLPLTQCLLPWVVWLFFSIKGAAATPVSPWAVVGVLLCADVLIASFCWKRLASNCRARHAEAALLFLAAFVPLATFRFWIAEMAQMPLTAEQVLYYSLGQLLVYGGFVWGMELYGNYGERRYSEKVLSGKIKFKSRKDFLDEREQQATEKKKR